MTPYFKTLNSILCPAIAMHCQAEVYMSTETSTSTLENAQVEIVSALENQEAKRQLNLGLQNCLLGYQEKARHHFSEALKADNNCLLAHVGMLMVYPSGSDNYKLHLQQVNLLVDNAILTPAEEWYLSAFLQYIMGDVPGAAKAFHKRASHYRRDLMAACWDILLNHYAAEQGGDIISRADKLIRLFPDNGPAHFCRAILDEYSPKPSQNALKSAQKAVKLLPRSAPAHQLLGHLLSLTGKHKDAIKLYQKAQQLSTDDLSTIELCHAATNRISALSEASSYWQNGNKIDALKRSMALTRQIPKQINPGNEGDILLHWEARTLPLRLLVLQPTAPAGAAINAAAKACNAPDGDPVHIVQQCLVAAIQTRSLADAGRFSVAAQTLQKAENYLAHLQRESHEMSHRGGITNTCYKRALRACQAALYRAKVSLYPDSSHIWQPYLDEQLAIPESRLLPPILPQLP